jgi:hypothetical protein
MYIAWIIGGKLRHVNPNFTHIYTIDLCGGVSASVTFFGAGYSA